MEHFTPKYRRDPNAKVESLYYGVAPGGQRVTKMVKPGLDNNALEATRNYETGHPRGEGGHIGHLILGGMETTLDEMEYLMEAHKHREYDTQRRSKGEIVDMCYDLINYRNDRLKYFQKNPSEMPLPPKDTVRLHLPVGMHWAGTSEPGLQIAARI